MTKEDDYKLNIFQRQCFKKILNVHWPMKVSDEEIRERSSARTSDDQITTWRWIRLGHDLVKNVIGQKSQDYTNMSSRRQTQKGATERDLEVKHKLREGTSRTEDAEGGRGCGQRQSGLEEEGQ